MTRHHAHMGNHTVMAVGTVVVIACAAVVVAMAWALGGSS